MATDTTIIEALKAARTRKGLSQRALSQLVGMPQSHISKIEAGQVDLQLSSLTELGRVLELELRLVPRKAVPAVDSVVRSVAPSTNDDTQARISDDLRRIVDGLSAYDHGAAVMRYERLRDTLQFMQHVTIPADLNAAQKALETLLKLVEKGELADPASSNAVKHATDTLRVIRNRLAHPTAQPTGPRPAYQLEEEDDA
jgi:transcriptional regulator with XRE-family HTH domain